MSIGFDHLKNCTAIERIILHKCAHMENEALERLVHVKNTLKELQVTECGNVEDDGLLSLKQLTHLEKLRIYGFPYVKNFDKVVAELRASLPKCDIQSTKE